MKKIKLLYITNSIETSGGLERVLSVKASYLADKLDYSVHILVLNSSNQKTFYKFSNSIHFHSVEVAGKPIIYIYQYISKIKKKLKSLRPDIISVCDDGFKGLLFPILFGKRIPVIYERHVSKNIEHAETANPTFYQSLKLRVKHNLMNFGATKFDRFVVLTNGNTKEWNVKNIDVIANPLPFVVDKISKLSNKKILVVGKHSYQKGYDRLLKIWDIVKSKHPNWSVEVYGRDITSLKYAEKALKMNLSPSLQFLPPVKNIQEKYQEASIYLMTSRFEGFGMVLIEAMAHGVPCISYDCPHGPADIISHEKDGILIKNGDIESFADAIIDLIENEEKRKQMGQVAKQNVKRYLPEQVMPLWDELFKELVN